MQRTQRIVLEMVERHLVIPGHLIVDRWRQLLLPAHYLKQILSTFGCTKPLVDPATKNERLNTVAGKSRFNASANLIRASFLQRPLPYRYPV